MKNLFFLLIVSTLLFSCEKKETEDNINTLYKDTVSLNKVLTPPDFSLKLEDIINMYDDKLLSDSETVIRNFYYPSYEDFLFGIEYNFYNTNSTKYGLKEDEFYLRHVRYYINYSFYALKAIYDGFEKKYGSIKSYHSNEEIMFDYSIKTDNYGIDLNVEQQLIEVFYYILN